MKTPEASEANAQHYIGECRYCGAKLPKHRKVFCSALCRMRWHSREYRRNKRKAEKVERVCVVCGRVIKNLRTKYCSQKCHNAFYFKPRVSPPREMTCVICGTKFVSKGFKKTCSKECYQANNRANVKRLYYEKKLQQVVEDITPVETTIRKCLRCDKQFVSEGNRICPQCTKVNDYLISGIDYHYYVGPTIRIAC